MQPTLDEAIRAVFSGLPAASASATTEVKGSAPTPTLTKASEDRLNQVRKRFDMAQDALKRGNWTEFGQDMEALKELLGR
jgi:uncharacterized membrane protein (UPF0182 family)